MDFLDSWIVIVVLHKIFNKICRLIYYIILITIHMSTRQEGFWTWIKSCYSSHITFMMDNDATDMLTFITDQMAAKQGCKHFGSAGSEVIMKELEQLIYRKVMEGHHARQLSTTEKKAALHYLMFLKQKCWGWIKGWRCADEQKQHTYKTKEET